MIMINFKVGLTTMIMELRDGDCSYPRVVKSNLNHFRILGINILSLNFVWLCHKN